LEESFNKKKGIGIFQLVGGRGWGQFQAVEKRRNDFHNQKGVLMFQLGAMEYEELGGG